MDLNKETAMRLWNKHYGKKSEVYDFAGRKMMKGAYNDRNSDYGWNVDHILPQSKGGKTADYNLVCCHIITNDEKADKFPAFKTNGKSFEIIKVENHYEIRPLNKKNKNNNPDDIVNFMDSASGVRFFKNLKGIQNKPRYVGSVLIRLQDVRNTAVVDFIEKLFDEENLSFSMGHNYLTSQTEIVAINYNMPLVEDVAKLLDKCIVLNTYLKNYFIKDCYISKYDIFYQVINYENKVEMYLDSRNISFSDLFNRLDNTLYINNLVYINTDAKNREKDLDFRYYKYCKYDYTYVKLSENLNKEVSE